MFERKKIGIMGGSFNPIHNGHLIMAENARIQYNLDKVWFMPNGNPPHKDLSGMPDGETRCRMTLLAISDNPYFELSRHEIDKKEVSYTYASLGSLKKKHPNVDFYYIMGGDSVYNFKHWVHPEIIAGLCTILAAPREEIHDDKLKAAVKELWDKYRADIRIIDIPSFDVSSFLIRERIQTNLPIKYLVPAKVEQYIRENKLYENRTGE